VSEKLEGHVDGRGHAAHVGRGGTPR